VQKSLLAGVCPRREEAGKMPALLCLHQSEMRPSRNTRAILRAMDVPVNYLPGVNKEPPEWALPLK